MDLLKALERFLAAKRRSVATQNRYRYSLGKHIAFLGPKRDVTSVMVEDIDRWEKKQRGLGLSVWTVNGRIKDVKAFWQWLEDAGYVMVSPAASQKVLQFKPNRMRQMAISDENLARLMAYAKKKNAREYAIVRLLADTGCRRAAVINLRLSDLDLKNHEATLIGKGDTPYDVALSSRLVDALTCYIAERPQVTHDYVFATVRRPYGPLSKQGAASMWRRLVREAGLSEGRYNMHSLRHWFTSRLARMGVNMAYIQEALGHRDLETTRLYVGVCKETLKEIVESAAL
jgi:integrase/recombinase XerC